VFIGKAFKSAAIVILLQILDNAAKGHLKEHPAGEIFDAHYRKLSVTTCALVD
jgi:hypothetical protein